MSNTVAGGVRADVDPAHARRWWILAVIVFGLVVVILDTTVLNVALKTIADPHHGLGATQADLEWALNSYTLIFAGLLITFGALGDRLGHKRIIIAGMATFTIGSLIAAYAGGAAQLIAGRAVMGIGGAAIMPATLAIISHVFEPQERPKAIGIWGASVGVGAAAGPILGGLLLQHFWWGSVFLINVLVAIVAIPLMLALVPESRNPNPRKLDPLGAALSTVGLAALVYGIVRGGDLGRWADGSVWIPIVGGLVVLVGFVVWEMRVPAPAIDMSTFRSPAFSAAVGVVLLVFLAAMGGLFFGTFYLQSVHGLSPLMAGVWMIPFAVAQLIFAPRSARLVRAYGARTVVGLGAALVAVSFAPFIVMTASTPMWVFGVLFFVEGVGVAIVVAPMAVVVMSSVPKAKAGAAGAVNNTFRQIGGALGVAVIGTVLTGVYRGRMTSVVDASSAVPAGVRHDVTGSITATTGYVEQHQAAHPELASLLHPATDAFIQAMHVAAVGCVIAGALSAIVALVWIPGKAPAPATTPVQPAPAPAPVRPPADVVAGSEAG